jgi:hypothetical protein
MVASGDWDPAAASAPGSSASPGSWDLEINRLSVAKHPVSFCTSLMWA